MAIALYSGSSEWSDWSPGPLRCVRGQDTSPSHRISPPPRCVNEYHDEFNGGNPVIWDKLPPDVSLGSKPDLTYHLKAANSVQSSHKERTTSQISLHE